MNVRDQKLGPQLAGSCCDWTMPKEQSAFTHKLRANQCGAQAQVLLAVFLSVIVKVVLGESN